MSSRLEQFIRDNRDKFDTDEPREQIWKKLEQQLTPHKKKRPVMVIKVLRFSAAAAILVLAGLGVWSSSLRLLFHIYKTLT